MLVDAFGWRAIFLGRAPLGALTMGLAMVSLREVPPSHSQAYDVRGAIVLFVGIASCILFLTLGGRNGWTTLPVLILLALSIVSFSTFVYIERDRSLSRLRSGLAAAPYHWRPWLPPPF